MERGWEIQAVWKTLVHFFPQFNAWFERIEDPRQSWKIRYPLVQVLHEGLFLFLLQLKSRRAVTFELRAFADAARNLSCYFQAEGVESGFKKRGGGLLAHGDTLAYLLERINPEEVGLMLPQMVESLIRSIGFLKERVLGEYYLFVVDGTASASFSERHCEFCLTKRVGEGEKAGTVYYHSILEAKWVLSKGVAFSAASEFIQNEKRNPSKQDCELKAFYRLIQKLKQRFPRLKICLGMDSLYANQPVIERCRKNRWGFLISFKEGAMPQLYKECQRLIQESRENRFFQREGDEERAYAWVENVEWEKGLLVNALRCRKKEKKTQRETDFFWLTNLPLSKRTCAAAAKAGRMRWKIENEGFNIQKNSGYELEHLYSEDPTAMQNFYYLLQMAHTIRQLLEKGNLFSKPAVMLYGSLEKFSRALWRVFTTVVLDLKRLKACLSQRCQIRFNSS